MKNICHECIKNNDLKDIILRSKNIANCTICKKESLPVISWENPDLKNLARALIRYNYSEWDYNSHFGGDGIEPLFYQENPIFNYYPDKIHEYEEMIMDITDPAYTEYDKGISLYAGYENGEQNKLLRSLKTDTEYTLLRLQKKLEKQNYFALEDETIQLLQPHIKTLQHVIISGTKFFRARIGYKKKLSLSFSMNKEFHYEPYSGDSLSCPPPLVASNGRMNRPGVSFLYVATEESTAFAEVRPHPGHYISVGQFQSKKDFKIADFNSISIKDYSSSDKELDKFLLLKSIDQFFSMPIIPEERNKYSITQLLSEAIRKLGFDGISYKSSVGAGANFVFFDPLLFEYVPESAVVLNTESLVYKYSPLPLKNKDEVYS